MIVDTTFLIALEQERRSGRVGPALRFLHRNRGEKLRVTVISLSEFAAGTGNNEAARRALAKYDIIRLDVEAAYEAATVDRELIQAGARLGENDTLIAGIARYYGEPLLSNDQAFSRVSGLKVRTY
jgi:predicted nucleic acid-binding protein